MEQTQKLKKFDFEKALKSGYSKSQIVNSLRNNYDTNLDWEKINEDLKELNPKERDEALFDSLYNNQEIWGISGIKTKEPPKGLQNRIPSDNQIQHIEKEVQNMPQWGIESALMPQIIREAINVNVDGFWKMFQNKEEIARENALKNALDKGITQKLEKGESLSIGEILRYYNANDMKGHFTPQSHYKEQQELKKIAQTNFENLDESQKRELQKQNLITRLWNSPKELHDNLKDEVTKREADEHTRARAEQLERDIINIQRTHENLLTMGADYLRGSTEKRDKYREMLQESAISLGFDGIGFKGDRIYAFKGDNAIFIDDGFFKNLGQILGTNAFDIGGSITGAIAGAKRGTGRIGKLAGAIAGGAVGAGLGGIADSIIAQYNSRGEFNLADALLTGAESATFDIAGGLIVSGGAKAVKGAVKGVQNLLSLNPFPITSTLKNSIGSENIQAAKELVEQTFTQEQKDDILAFSKSFGGNLELQGKDTLLTKSAEFLTQKYGADSKIAKVANALEDYSKAHNKAQAREDILTLIRADEKGQSLGILLEVAKNSTLANKNLREILNATSYKLKKEIESLGLKENAFKEVFKDLSSGTKEDYDEAFNKILGELYEGEKVVLNGEAYAKFREKMGDLIELDPQGMQFLKFVEKGIYNPNGVDFTQLNNAKKLLNSYYTSTNNPSTKDFIKNVVESTIREDINKGVNQIFLSRPEQFEKAKKLYDAALSDYSIMRETFKTLDNLGFNDISKTNAQLMDNLINFIQGSGGLKEVDNYALLTKGLKKEQVESLELNALHRIYEKNLLKDSKDSTFEVFNSAKFLEDTAKLRKIFQSEGAQKFIEIMQGFNRLFGNDATIALKLEFANPPKEGSAIAQSVEGAVQQKIVKGIFGILMRNLPTSNKIIDKLGFKEKVQKMALAHHIEQALKSAYSINDFTFALKKISDDPSTPSPTRQAIIEFSKDLTRLVEDTREKADIDKTAQALKEQDNNTSLKDTIQALKEKRKQELQRAIQEKMAKEAQESQALKAAQQEKQRIKDAQVGKAINEVDLNLQGAIQARALKPTRINLENKSYPAEFAIINKNDLKPNFETKGTQGRTQKQENVIQDIQENLNPNKLFFSEGGFEGLPIILKDGQVSVGNHRAEALKNLSQESLAAYKKSAKEVFGVDLKENELIVRMLDERIHNEEILNLSFASNVGREQNLSEKALSTLGKYQEDLDKLPQNIYAQNVEEMQQIVAKSLDKTNNGLNTFDTNLALLSSLAKSKDKNILDALNAISGDAEQKAKVIKMFVENAGNFHNLAKQTQMPNLDLRDYLTQALYFTAKADKSRVENFKELAQEMKSIIQTTDAQGKNALIQEESHYNELIGKALGYSFARFRELENPSGSFFDFLSNIKLALSEELEPTLFSAGRPLSSADIYDFLSVSIKSGIPSNETSEVLELLPQLKAKHEAFKEANTNTQRNGNGNHNSNNNNNSSSNNYNNTNRATLYGSDINASELLGGTYERGAQTKAQNAESKISKNISAQADSLQTQGITEEIKQLIDTGAQKGRDMQIIGQENFTPEVVEYVQQQNKKVAIEKLSQEEAEALGFKYPQDVRVTIDSSAINHTLNRHGAESNLAQKSGQKAVSYDDIAKYREYAKNADETLQSVDNGGSNVLVSYKQVNGHFVVVEQIKKKNNELGFKTLFKEQGNYKDSKSYKDTKAKAQTLSIGYEPSANSFASAKSLNSNAIIPQSTKEAIDPANRFAEPFSNELFSALPKAKQAQYQSLQKQAGLLYDKYHQAKGIEAKRAYEKQYNAMLDKIYDFEQKYPVRVSSTQVQVRGNTMPTYKPDEIIDVEIIAQEPSIQKQITYKRHNLRAKAIQSLQVKLEALKPYPQKQIEYKRLESQINTLVEKQHKELRQPSLFSEEDLGKNRNNDFKQNQGEIQLEGRNREQGKANRQHTQKTDKKENELIKDFTNKLKAYEVKSPRLDSLPSGEVAKSDGTNLRSNDFDDKIISQNPKVRILHKRLEKKEAENAELYKTMLKFPALPPNQSNNARRARYKSLGLKKEQVLAEIQAIKEKIIEAEIEALQAGDKTTLGEVQEVFTLPNKEKQFKINNEWYHESALKVKADNFEKRITNLTNTQSNLQDIPFTDSKSKEQIPSKENAEQFYHLLLEESYLKDELKEASKDKSVIDDWFKEWGEDVNKAYSRHKELAQKLNNTPQSFDKFSAEFQGTLQKRIQEKTRNAEKIQDLQKQIEQAQKAIDDFQIQGYEKFNGFFLPTDYKNARDFIAKIDDLGRRDRLLIFHTLGLDNFEAALTRFLEPYSKTHTKEQTQKLKQAFTEAKKFYDAFKEKNIYTFYNEVKKQAGATKQTESNLQDIPFTDSKGKEQILSKESAVSLENEKILNKRIKEFADTIDEYHNPQNIEVKDIDSLVRFISAWSGKPLTTKGFLKEPLKYRFTLSPKNFPQFDELAQDISAWVNRSLAIPRDFRRNVSALKNEKTDYSHIIKHRKLRNESDETKKRIVSEYIPKIQNFRTKIEQAINLHPIKDFGTNYAEYYRDGQGAIAKILAEAKDYETRKVAGNLTQEELEQGAYKGQVAGAFYRKDLEELSGNGNIDVVWGEITDAQAHKGYGLVHILDKHKKEFKDIAKDLSEIVENGKLIKDDKGRLRIENENYIIGIKDNFKGKKDNNWIVTAYEKKEGGGSLYTSPHNHTSEIPLETSTDIIPQNAEQFYDLHHKITDLKSALKEASIDQDNNSQWLKKWGEDAHKAYLTHKELAQKHNNPPQSFKDFKAEFQDQLQKHTQAKMRNAAKIQSLQKQLEQTQKAFDDFQMQGYEKIDGYFLPLNYKDTSDFIAQIRDLGERNQYALFNTLKSQNFEAELLQFLEFFSKTHTKEQTQKIEQTLAEAKRFYDALKKKDLESFYNKAKRQTKSINNQQTQSNSQDIPFTDSKGKEQILSKATQEQLIGNSEQLLKAEKAQELQTLKQKLQNADKQTKREILLSCLQEDSKRITDEIMEAMRIAEEKDFLPHEIEEAKNRLSANIPPERKEAIAILHLTEKLKEKIPNLIKEKKQIVKEILYLERFFSAHDILSLERLAKIEKRVLKSLDEDILENNLTYRVATTEGEARARELFESCKPDSEQRELFERILPIAQKLNVEIKQAINNKKLSKVADGVYYTGLNSVRVKNNRVTQEKGKVFLHELIHSVTSRAMIAYETGKKELLTPNQVAAIRNIKEIYSDTLKNHKDLGFELESKTKVGDYGLVSSHEFIAELSNPTFREKLKKVGVFEKIVDNILRLFVSAKEAFMLKKNNAYDTLKKNLYAIIDDYKEDFTAAYEMAKIKNTEILQGNRTTQAQIQAKFKFDEKKAKDLAEWHKDSSPLTKDEQGLPKVFYHGSEAEKKFKVFEKDNTGSGFFFTPFKSNAQGYKPFDSIPMFKVFLKAQKPFKANKIKIDSLNDLQKISEDLGLGIKVTQEHFKEFKNTKQYIDEIKKRGESLGWKLDETNGTGANFMKGNELESINLLNLNYAKPQIKEAFNGISGRYAMNRALDYYARNDFDIALNTITRDFTEYQTNKSIKDILKAKGYDSIVFNDYQISVFDSNQIKAVENKGLKGESGEHKYFNAESPNIYHSNAHIGSGLVSGSVAGFETDEQGNLNFNPANFLLGLAGGAVGSKAIAQGFKAIHKNPELKAKVTKELADTLSKGWDSATKAYPILSTLEPRHIIAKSERGRTLQAKHILKEVEKEEIYRLRESTKQMLHNIVGKNITNAHDGRIAQVSKKNIGKMVSDKAIAKSVANGFSAMEHFNAVNDIESLYKNAIFKETTADKHGEIYLKIHRYNAQFENANALITLKETTEHGNKIYTLELEELEAPTKQVHSQAIGEQLSKSRKLEPMHPNTPLENSESIIPQIQDNETIAKEIVNAIEIPTLPYSEKEINSVLEKYRKAVEADKKQLEPLAPTLSRSDAKALLRADKALFDKYKQYANGKEGEMGIAIMAKQLRDDLNAQINTRNAEIKAKAAEIEQKHSAIYDEYLSMRKQSQDVLDKNHIKTELKDYDTIDNIANLLENGYNVNDIQYFINKALKGNELAYNILRNYDTNHTGRGYSGYSMSNNAIDAYANGIKPISKWNSKDAKEFGELIGVKVSLKELKDFLMRCGEKGYHHTSKFYNETKFYSLAEAMSDKNILLKYFPDTKLY